MSLSLKEELLKLSNTAPNLREPDDDAYSDNETNAKVSSKTAELDVVEPSEMGRVRIRQAISDLSEYGKRYKGKSVARKQLNRMNSDDDDEEDENDNDDDDDEGEDNEDDKEEEEEEGDDDEEEDDEEDDEEDEEDEEDQKTSKSKGKANKRGGSESQISLINMNRGDEIEKGKAVKNQLNFWDLLLEIRIKLQNSLNTGNQLPQHDIFDQLISSLQGELKNTNQLLVKDNANYIEKAINQLIELQQRLFMSDAETAYLIKDLNLLKRKRDGDDEANGNDKNANGSKKSKSAKGKVKENAPDAEDDDKDEDEDDDEENEDDEDNEEIFSDTDDEMRANELKASRKQSKLAKFTFAPVLGSQQMEDYLARVNKTFHKYRNATIQKWYDKTRLITGKSFQSLEKPLLQQIEHILMDKDRILKRTQLKRGQFAVCGKVERPAASAATQTVASSLEARQNELKERKDLLKDYDAEIFDDQDFYNQLLRELIDRKSSHISDPIELSRKSIELQSLRTRNKKKVDTKASKGRKIKFEVHKPLVNFMAPIYRTTMSEEAKNELFRSLFANHITMSTSSNGANANGQGQVESFDYNQLFQGF